MALTLHLTRDSVADDDDIDAPHELALLVDDDATTEAMVHAILAAGYLPRIASSAAAWSVVSDRTLAVLAQQWPEPRMGSADPGPQPGEQQRDRYHRQRGGEHGGR